MYGNLKFKLKTIQKYIDISLFPMTRALNICTCILKDVDKRSKMYQKYFFAFNFQLKFNVI